MKLFHFCCLMLAASPIVAGSKPNIIVISVDTLRADRLSGYGYGKPTSPHIDRLMAQGARFTRARTVEPLTAPALTSMLTSLHPHQHGATRNGMPIFPELQSITKRLQAKGYRTAAFVGNWTLRDGITGLGEHFEEYHEVFTRKRWLGLFASEATAEDLTKQSLTWLNRRKASQPFFLWVHYVDPHGPYRFQKKFAKQLGLPLAENLSKSDRYDSEIAFTDHQIGIFLEGLYKVSSPEDSLIFFLSDHGESLGEHNYWGHGRHLYEPTLRIPFSIVWPGVVPAGTVDAPALITDLPRTILGFLEDSTATEFGGFNWSAVLQNQAQPPHHRITYYQAHKGAVQQKRNADRGRQKGLLEVAVIQDEIKETYRVKGMVRRLFDINQDPEELRSLVKKRSELSDNLKQWALNVERALNQAMDRPDLLSDKDVEMLRSLGYIE